jgi:hypothetical protein
MAKAPSPYLENLIVLEIKTNKQTGQIRKYKPETKPKNLNLAYQCDGQCYEVQV